MATDAQDDPIPGLLWKAAAALRDDLTETDIDSLEENLRTRIDLMRGQSGPQRGMRRGMRQDAPDRPRRGRMERPMGNRMNLTGDQRDAMRDLRQEYADKLSDTVATLMADGASQSDALSTYQELAAEREAALREILTDEQASMMNRRRATRMAQHADRRAAREEALSLTSEQLAGLMALHRLEWRPAVRGNIDQWLQARKAILSDSQMEIVIIHAALRADRMRGRFGPRGHRRGGPRGR